VFERARCLSALSGLNKIEGKGNDMMCMCLMNQTLVGCSRGFQLHWVTMSFMTFGLAEGIGMK
jgi:hypothetical protein